MSDGLIGSELPVDTRIEPVLTKVEVIEKRTETTKHFHREDGTYVAEIHIAPIHHIKEGSYVDTDYTLHDAALEVQSGENPIPFKFDKATGAIYVEIEGHPLELLPQKGEKELVEMKVLTTALAIDSIKATSDPWAGVELAVNLIPYGIRISYTVTSIEGQKPIAWVVTDKDGVFLNYFGTSSYTDEKMQRVDVPETYDKGIWIIDLSAVPVGTTVE
jgi:hypothetical protein